MAMRPMAAVLVVLLAAGAARGQHIEAGDVLAVDDFDRFGEATAEIGAPPEGGRAWGKAVTPREGRPMSVTFALDVPDLPETALDMIRWRETTIEYRVITEDFRPFAVHAWRIVPD